LIVPEDVLHRIFESCDKSEKMGKGKKLKLSASYGPVVDMKGKIVTDVRNISVAPLET
jgi:hypothetical protein